MTATVHSIGPKADARRRLIAERAMAGGCIVCGGPEEHWHHVVPESLGGEFVVPLCESCHASAHDRTTGNLGRKSVLAKYARGEVDRNGAGIRFGFDVDPETLCLVKCPDEWPKVERIKRLWNDGASLTKIVERLAKDGVTNRSGTSKWERRVVDTCIRTRPDGSLYAGSMAREHRKRSKSKRSAHESEVVDLWRKGWKLHEIGEKFGMSHEWAHTIVRARGLSSASRRNAVIAKIAGMSAAGMTYARIAESLTRAGYRPSKRAMDGWTAKAVEHAMSQYRAGNQDSQMRTANEAAPTGDQFDLFRY